MKNAIWKSVVGYEGIYEVSDGGCVRSVDRITPRGNGTIYRKGQEVKAYLDKHGYLFYQLRSVSNGKSFKKNIKAHRLVSEAFLSNSSQKPFVNHINGIKTDNRVENLEWCTRSENAQHAIKTGLVVRPSGEDAYTSKFSQREAEKIRLNFRHGVDSYESIGRKHSVSGATIASIVKNIAYTS